MTCDESKVDEVVRALLGACELENGRVWNRIDFAVMDRRTRRAASPTRTANRSRFA